MSDRASWPSMTVQVKHWAGAATPALTGVLNSNAGHLLLDGTWHSLIFCVWSRSLGGQPSRVLASFVSRSARPASAPGAQGKQLNVADKGMSRAVSRIMTRTRTVKLSVSGATAIPGVDDDEYACPPSTPRLAFCLQHFLALVNCSSCTTAWLHGC